MAVCQKHGNITLAGWSDLPDRVILPKPSLKIIFGKKSIPSLAIRLPGEGDKYMAQFMLLLRDTPERFNAYSAEDIQTILNKYRSWRESQGDRILQGKKLKYGEGRVMRKGSSMPVVTDGPFAESKEIMGGYFVVEANSYDAAVEIASTCPHIQFGTIEVRAVEIVG